MSEKKFGLGAPVWAWGAPKCQNFEFFVSQARTVKFGQDVDFRSLISYKKKIVDLGLSFGAVRGGVRSIKTLKNYGSQVRVFNFPVCVDHVN